MRCYLWRPHVSTRSRGSDCSLPTVLQGTAYKQETDSLKDGGVTGFTMDQATLRTSPHLQAQEDGTLFVGDIVFEDSAQ